MKKKKNKKNSAKSARKWSFESILKVIFRNGNFSESGYTSPRIEAVWKSRIYKAVGVPQLQTTSQSYISEANVTGNNIGEGGLEEVRALRR